MSDVTLTAGQRCFVLREKNENSSGVTEARNCPAIARRQKADVSGGTITVRESVAREILSDQNALRILQSSDGSEVVTIKFERAAGTSGTIVAAVPFNEGRLVEWRSGTRQWLVLHSANGKPQSTEMELPVDGELFDSQTTDGLHFLRWLGGRPEELIIVKASVEWSRAPQ
jgi:hypothetical protein